MDQYQCRGKLLKNFQDHWSIRISPGKGMDQWLVHMNFPRKRYGPMALKVLWKFRSWPVSVHRVLFPAVVFLVRLGPLGKLKSQQNRSTEAFKSLLSFCPPAEPRHEVFPWIFANFAVQSRGNSGLKFLRKFFLLWRSQQNKPENLAKNFGPNFAKNFAPDCPPYKKETSPKTLLCRHPLLNL